LPEKYSGGVFVVFTTGISKYFDLLLGNNNSIVFNSKYYRVVLFFGLAIAALAIVLNAWLIPLYGINGSAIATLIAITLYSLSKLMFFMFKTRLFPFTIKTIYALVASFFLFEMFYYWEFPFHPLTNIVLKSPLLSVCYVFTIYHLKLPADVN